MGLLCLGACEPAERWETEAVSQEEVGTTRGLLRVAEPVRGQYIVTFNDRLKGSVGAEARALAAAHGGEVLFIYEHALRGFAVKLPEAAALQLARNPLVAQVEEDAVTHGDAYTQNTTANSPLNLWNLDRIDQRALPLSNTYTLTRTGRGVNVYVLDSGIFPAHQDFNYGYTVAGARAFGVFTAVNDGNGTNDCHGHGTHVAGTIGGYFSGVAKDANLRAVRVLDCNNAGTASITIAGLDWVRANAVRPAVANMSIGFGGRNSSAEIAMTNLINSGIALVVSAGNNSADACNYTPGAVTAAIVTGATDSADNRASFSNFGPCLDLFAPGVAIWSANIATTNWYVTMDGTSMAAPAVAGMAARYLEANPSATPASVQSWIVNNATTNVVINPGLNSPNRLAYIAPTH